MEYNQNCGLSKEEWELEKIVEQIKKEPSTLACIGVLKQALHTQKIDNNIAERNDLIKELFELWQQLYANGELYVGYGFTDNYRRLEAEVKKLNLIDVEGKELTENELVNLGFEIVRWKEPNYYVGVDRFYKLDYAIMRINKKSGIADDLVIRFREGKFVLDNYYSVRFFTVQDITDLISSLTKVSKT